MLNTVGRFIYTKYCMLNTVESFIYTKYWGILLVEHCGNIYLHIILGNTLCWTLWEDLFTQNTEKYFMLTTVGIFIYTQYWELLYVEHCGKMYLHKIPRNTVCWALWEDLLKKKTWGLLYVEHYGKIYLHKILGITLCWTLWEDYLHKIFGNTLFWTMWEDLFT